jgi:RNA polymerase sigma-70 factor (ECF subfamily)
MGGEWEEMLGRIRLQFSPEARRAERTAGAAGSQWLDRKALVELPDALLVREAKGGNSEAYGELVSRYQDKLFTLIYGQIQAREDALDLTQDVFIKAHGAIGRFREDAVFYTWLYRIAVNACIDYNRRRKRCQEPFSLESEILTESGYEPVDESPWRDPERVLENKELRARLRRAIDSLSEPLRVAVLMHDVEGLSQKEIAELLSCPLGTVKSRIQRGRLELRQKLASFVDGGA